MKFTDETRRANCQACLLASCMKNCKACPFFGTWTQLELNF